MSGRNLDHIPEDSLLNAAFRKKAGALIISMPKLKPSSETPSSQSGKPENEPKPKRK